MRGIMIGRWGLCEILARPTINRRANLQSLLKRTLRTESPSGGFAKKALGFSPGWECSRGFVYVP
jgi:hypothetical protein